MKNQLAKKKSNDLCEKPKDSVRCISINREYFIVDDSGQLQQKTLDEGIKRLKAAFPRTESPFFNELIKAIIRNELTENDFKGVINDVIDNYRYTTLTVADVLKYRKKKALLSRNDMLKQCEERGKTQSELFKPVRMDDKTWWMEL